MTLVDNFPWPKLGRPSLCLAPMEGVTDAPMRAVQGELGAFAYCVSEFLRVSQEVLPAKVFLRDIPELNEGCRTRSGVPVQIQLLGGDPGRLAESARVAVRLGARAIDLNFGCPAPTVNRHDGGATLLKYPHRIREIVRAVREALPPDVPVSAKLRLGWDSLDAVDENAAMAQEGGASWIAIHGRTRVAGYAPPAYWKPIGRVREALRIPVIANGEIWTLEDFRRCRGETGCEHFMLGRGALADPFLPLNAAHELGIAVATPLQEWAPGRAFGASPHAWASLFSRFADATGEIPHRPQHLARRFKQWAKMATQNLPLDWFERIKTAPVYEEILATLSH